MNPFSTLPAFGFFSFTYAYWQGWRSFTPPVRESATA